MKRVISALTLTVLVATWSASAGAQTTAFPAKYAASPMGSYCYDLRSDLGDVDDCVDLTDDQQDEVGVVWTLNAVVTFLLGK